MDLWSLISLQITLFLLMMVGAFLKKTGVIGAEGKKCLSDLCIKAGEKPADIRYETLAEYAKFVNMKAVKDFGGDFPASAYEGFKVLVEEDGTSHFNQ